MNNEQLILNHADPNLINYLVDIFYLSAQDHEDLVEQLPVLIKKLLKSYRSVTLNGKVLVIC